MKKPLYLCSYEFFGRVPEHRGYRRIYKVNCSVLAQNENEILDALQESERFGESELNRDLKR